MYFDAVLDILAERFPTGNIASGYTQDEIAAIREEIVNDSDSVRTENQDLETLLHDKAASMLSEDGTELNEALRQKLVDKKIPQAQIEAVKAALSDGLLSSAGSIVTVRRLCVSLV